jgi:hypothetical protein
VTDTLVNRKTEVYPFESQDPEYLLIIRDPLHPTPYRYALRAFQYYLSYPFCLSSRQVHAGLRVKAFFLPRADLRSQLAL